MMELRSERLIDEAQERASKFYDLSKDFVRENQIAVLIGVGAFLGIVSFFLGRASKSD